MIANANTAANTNRPTEIQGRVFHCASNLRPTKIAKPHKPSNTTATCNIIMPMRPGGNALRKMTGTGGGMDGDAVEGFWLWLCIS